MNSDYERSILSVLNDVLSESKLCGHIESVFTQMAMTFCLIPEAVEVFLKLTGFELNVEMSYERLSWILLMYKNEFIRVCSKFADMTTIQPMNEEEW